MAILSICTFILHFIFHIYFKLDGSGPRFGSEGLTIALEKSNPKLVRSKLGLYYERLPDGSNSLFPGGKSNTDELVDLKVFVGVYDKDERIPYSDAMFFQIN